MHIGLAYLTKKKKNGLLKVKKIKGWFSSMLPSIEG